MRVVVEKFVQERGLYPRPKDKIKLSEVLGKLFNQQPCDFYEKSSCQGYITYALQGYRKRRQKGQIETTNCDMQSAS